MRGPRLWALGLMAASVALQASPARARQMEPASAFAPPPDAAPPARPIEGRLEITFGPRPGGLRILRDDAPPRGVDPRRAWPAFKADLVTDGTRVIVRSLSPSSPGAGAWDWSAGPGRIWSQGQGAVAVFPVALREVNANCVHQGLARLSLDGDGAVTAAKVQIGAQTCVYYRFEAWASGQPRWSDGPIADREALIARDRALRAVQLPAAPLSALGRAYPGIDTAALTKAAGDPAAVYGLVANGINYVAPCRWSFGEDAYCEGRTLPSYSLAKSLVGGLGLMRLERLRPGLAQTPVAKLVGDCGAPRPWTDARLVDLLDMATGRYDSAAPQADEDASDVLTFFLSRTHAEKLTFACAHYPARAAPGSIFAYHTSDSYLLGVALRAALPSRPNAPGDLYDDVVRPIWRSLSMSPLLDETRRTLDATAQPFTGWGLFMTRDDAARLGIFLSPDNVAARSDLFDPDLIDVALQRRGLGEGLIAGGPHLRYAHGFWARDVAPLVGCAHPVWTPFLSGYGGISLVLFPNGVVFYAFGEENRFDWGPAVQVADRVKALCA